MAPLSSSKAPHSRHTRDYTSTFAALSIPEGFFFSRSSQRANHEAPRSDIHWSLRSGDWQRYVWSVPRLLPEKVEKVAHIKYHLDVRSKDDGNGVILPSASCFQSSINP